MLNVIAVMGRVVADPELRQTSSGVFVSNFTVACDRDFVKSGSERQTDFFDVVAWRKNAEFVSKYFKKGQLVAVNGSLQTRSYEDKNGVKHKVFEIMADNLHFASPKRDGSTASFNNIQTTETDDFKEIETNEDLPF